SRLLLQGVSAKVLHLVLEELEGVAGDTPPDGRTGVRRCGRSDGRAYGRVMRVLGRQRLSRNSLRHCNYRRNDPLLGSVFDGWQAVQGRSKLRRPGSRIKVLDSRLFHRQ